MSNHRYRANSDLDDQTAQEKEFTQNHGLLGKKYVQKSPQKKMFNDLNQYQNQGTSSTERALVDFATNGMK